MKALGSGAVLAGAILGAALLGTEQRVAYRYAWIHSEDPALAKWALDGVSTTDPDRAAEATYGPLPPLDPVVAGFSPRFGDRLERDHVRQPWLGIASDQYTLYRSGSSETEWFRGRWRYYTLLGGVVLLPGVCWLLLLVCLTARKGRRLA